MDVDYRIDEDSNEDRIVLVKLSGRAQAETIVTLLEDLNALAWQKAAALTYGLNRMFQGLATAAERVSVFNDRARARAWLLDG